jgi:hypothetical protein
MALTPEEQAMIANYWGTGQPAPAAPAPAPRQMQDFTRTTAPAPGSDDAIAAAYFAGQKPLPTAPSMEATLAAANGAAPPPVAPAVAPVASTLPPVETTTPGNLFGQRPAAPAQAPGREPPPPVVRQPAEFQREMVSGRPVAPAARPAAHGPVNADPYGAKAAMKGYLGTFDAQMDAVRRAHTAEGDKAIQIATHTQELARRREEDAGISQVEAQAAAEHFDARMSEVERQLDDVRAKKIDPNRLMRESPGMGLLAVIGGVVGGVYQGLTNGQENGFLRDLNRMIDRDIAAQERDMDNDTKHFGEKLNLISQQRAVWKDMQLAKMQTQNLYYEAAKENIAAEAARYDTPIYQARADEAIANIQRAQDEIKLKLAQQLQAQAAAAGARSAAQAKEVRDVFRETYDKALAAGLAPAQAEFEASRVVDVLYAGGRSTARGAAAGGSDPISLVPPKQQHEALEEQKKYAAAQKAKQALDEVWKRYEEAPDLPTWTGAAGRDAAISAGLLNVRQALGEGFSSDKDTQKYVESNLPSYMENAATRQKKLEGLKLFLDSKAATPILDRHAPGWREQTPTEQAKTLGLKPVK